jgi:hypothetical protein
MNVTFLFYFSISYDCMSLNGKWHCSHCIFSFVRVMFEYGFEIFCVDSLRFDNEIYIVIIDIFILCFYFHF